MPLLGFFLIGPGAWGFNHLAYLPRGFLVLSALGALLLSWRRAQEWLSERLSGTLPDLFFGPFWKRTLFVLGMGVLFVLLRERSFFMGDGYLVGELVDRGVKFRAFDNMDYLLHEQLHHALKTSQPIDSFTLYRAGAVLTGVIGLSVLLPLAGRLAGERWRRALWVCLFLATGPVVLFFGYVESYANLYLCLTAFLLSGVLAAQGRGHLWMASVWFGLAIAFHLTALFSAPALLILALRTPGRSAPRRWLEAALPALLIFGLSVVLHLAAGYDSEWFRKEFIDSKNAKSIWIPLFEPQRGFFSLYHWKDLLSLALIMAPAALLVVVSRVGWVRSQWRRPEVLFLVVQIVSVLGFIIFIDRKLGGARDWDLFSAHTGGLLLLAALALPAAAGDPPGAPVRAGRAPRTAGLLWGASALVVAPWILLLHFEERSIARFVDVAGDFPNFARAYAYEEVGKYYRKGGDLPRAEEMYERCVEAYPKNPRFLLLLGSVYYSQKKLDDAERLYRQALLINPEHKVGVEMIGKVLYAKAETMTRGPARDALYSESTDAFAHLVRMVPRNPDFWNCYGSSALLCDRLEEAVTAFQQALDLDPRQRVMHGLGTAYLGLGRLSEAVDAFRQAGMRNEANLATQMGLVMALVGRADEVVRTGRRPDPALLDEAARALEPLRQRNPGEPTAAEFARRIDLLRQGIAPGNAFEIELPGTPLESSTGGGAPAGDPAPEP
ncbi:MAG: tetratricopeptide repeat protein [Candidatus Eisenbacteria bacterium]|nr:tetratricopeptide repeat protein [Candidatus Eisenbacteria bacterium]